MEDKFANHTYNPEIRFRGYTDGWEQCKLNEICDYTSSSLTASSSIENGKYILYDANTEIGSVDSFSMNEDYITVIKDGAGVGRIRKLPKNTAFTGTMGALTSKNKETDFLYYLLERKDLSKQFTGSTIPHIYFKDYGKDAVNIPKDKEQQVIGSYFKQLDNLITLHQRKCDTLKNLKASMLTKMFPKEGESMPEIRFKGFTDSWEQRKLGDVLERRIEQRQQSEEYPRLAFASGQGVIPLSERKTNNREQLTKDEYTKKYLVTELNDIVYNPANVKYGAIDRNKCGRGLISPIYVTFTTNEIPGFIERIVTSHDFQQRALRFEEGTVTKRQSVNPEDLVTLDILVAPKREEQQKIATYFDSLDHLITLHQRKYEKLLDVKKAFLEKMIGGDN